MTIRQMALKVWKCAKKQAETKRKDEIEKDKFKKPIKSTKY